MFMEPPLASSSGRDWSCFAAASSVRHTQRVSWHHHLGFCSTSSSIMAQPQTSSPVTQEPSPLQAACGPTAKAVFRSSRSHHSDSSTRVGFLVSGNYLTPMVPMGVERGSGKGEQGMSLATEEGVRASARQEVSGGGGVAAVAPVPSHSGSVQ